MKNFGFTLAEVLITLAVIGIIAALTIPGLISSVEKSQYEAAFKKEYSVISRAYELYQANGNDMATDAFPGTDTGASALNQIAPYLNIIKNCGNQMGCLHDLPIYNLDGSEEIADFGAAFNSWGTASAILADGTMIVMKDNDNHCTGSPPHGTVTSGPLYQSVCGWMWLDVNGAKGPNTLGRDVFGIWLTKTGVYPEGSNGDPYGNDCGEGATVGQGCPAYVLAHGMDY